MEQLIQAMIEALNRAGLAAIAALPDAVMPRLTAPVVAVSPASAKSGEAGLYRYLGLEENREVYGRRLSATLRLEIFSPKSGGGAAVREAVRELMQVLLDGVPPLSVGEVNVGGVAFNADCDCFTCAVSAQAEAFVYATVSDDGTAFTDFTLKGAVK